MVRLATPADLPFIVAGAQALAAQEQPDSGLPLKPDFEHRLTHYFQHLLATPSALLLVAEQALPEQQTDATNQRNLLGYIAGSLQTMPNDFTEVALYGLVQVLWVSESARRLHIGQTLLQLFEATLREQGVNHIDAQHASSNLPAASFWQKQGYRPVSATVRKAL